ncbi:Hypothetical predicted protein, partial [Marmota monax]
MVSGHGPVLLQRLCTPFYCRYRFHKTLVHRTEERPHGTHVYFEDINVICLGAIHPSDLREYLEGPPMVVEVHDRDHKSDESSCRPTLFGEDPLDSHGNIQSFISSKETEDNPFQSQNKTWDSHGVTRVSFTDLLLGHKYLNLVVPIQRCEPKATPGLQGSQCRRVLRFHRGPPAQPDARWKLLGGQLIAQTASGYGSASEDLGQSPGLLKDITLINAKALELDSYPTGTVQQILPAFKMR